MYYLNFRIWLFYKVANKFSIYKILNKYWLYTMRFTENPYSRWNRIIVFLKVYEFHNEIHTPLKIIFYH